MTQKELLLKDLCARLPYGVKVQDELGRVNKLVIGNADLIRLYYNDFSIYGENALSFPYLRPLSSITEEERSDLRKYCAEHSGITYDIGISGATNSANIINWLLAHHFDIYDLIPMNLAIAVTEKNNPYKD